MGTTKAKTIITVLGSTQESAHDGQRRWNSGPTRRENSNIHRQQQDVVLSSADPRAQVPATVIASGSWALVVTHVGIECEEEADRQRHPDPPGSNDKVWNAAMCGEGWPV